MIVAENTSAQFGGEAFLPLHYFRILRARGIETWLVTHSRVRAELQKEFPAEQDRIVYVEDTALHVALWKSGAKLPQRIRAATFGTLLSLVTSWSQRTLVARMVRELKIDVVHQPIPVSPKAPSMMFNVGAPVVIGPLNGGMSFPPGMRYLEGRAEQSIVGVLRHSSDVVNRVLPGKRAASTILVANDRSRRALSSLPDSVRIVELVENGIDLSRWKVRERAADSKPLRLAFVGRLVDWKAVDLLLEAIARIPNTSAWVLEIYGDGPERARLEQQCRELHLEAVVTFHGFVPQCDIAQQLGECDVLVLPSLYECGGAVVLEAMALGLPVIASNWGGPADYLDQSCGILIPVESRDSFVVALERAIAMLVASPELRAQLGAAARRRVEANFDWERKVDTVLCIYGEAIQRSGVLTAD